MVRVRLIDTTSGEILGAFEEESIIDKKAAKIGGLYNKRVGNYREKLVQLAIEDAVTKVSDQLVALAPKMSITNHAITCKIADFSGGIVTLNKGKESGLDVGTTLKVKKVTREITDPDSGEVIRRVTEDVATIKITKAADGYSEATLESGDANLEVGLMAESFEAN